MRQNKALIFFVLALVVSCSSFVLAAPNGVSITDYGNETAGIDDAGQLEAIAGNVTELVLTGYSTTQTWQGYFGNVSGAIQLADNNDKVMYNWSLANPSGEVYASTNSSITWVNIQCFNFTANGSFADESGNGGTTNLAGVNLTNLEGMFNINSSAADGVDATFAAFNHDEFYTANQQFSADECPSAQIFDSSEASVDGNFEEALLYEPSTGSIVFASLLEAGSVNGFDGADHDFEMLVLEDGHGIDTDTTTYYFFVELE